MKKIYVSLVLMLFLGMSLVLAQDNPTEEIAVVSGGGGSAAGQLVTATPSPNVVVSDVPAIAAISTATSQKVCIINAELMKELDRLMKLLRETEDQGDEQAVKNIWEKIRTVKEEIIEDRERCEASLIKIVKAAPEKAVKVSLSEVPTEVTASDVRTTYVDKCTELEEWKGKKNHYENMYTLSDKVLEEKGYNKGREEIKEIIEELDSGIKKLEIECKVRMSTTSTSAGGGGKGSVVAVPSESADQIALKDMGVTESVAIVLSKPVAAESGEEITDYYKFKMGGIMKKETDTSYQITELKKLRNEIDELIGKLIKSKDEISAEEISELVTEIKIKPNEIKADNIIISAVNKKIGIKVNEKDLKIMPTETQVIIQDGNLEIKASELSIENEVLKVGNSEVQLTASDVVNRLNIEPKEIELKEENAKSVYKIKTEENRKLFGFIPVKVQKDLTVDSAEGGIIEEKASWWSFLTAKSK